MFFRSNAQFVVEGVMPNLLHVVPVGHNAVLDRVAQGQDATFALGFVANVRVLVAHADHNVLPKQRLVNRAHAA